MKKKNVSFKIKQYVMVCVQALAIAVLALSVAHYFLSARLYTSSNGNMNNGVRIASIGELRTDYYDSPIYTQNLNNIIDDISTFAIIREQLETAGKYDPSKRINIFDYAFRGTDKYYSGPTVYYNLDDLISWGQSGISHYYYTFDSFEQMDEYFSKNVHYVLHNKDEKASVEKVPEKKTEDEENVDEVDEIGKNLVPTLDMIKETYSTSDGKNIIYYSSNRDEYLLLCEALETSANALYKEYLLYQNYLDYFSSDKTNIKYYVYFGSDKNKKVYSNLTNYRIVSDESLPSLFRDMGEYIHVDFGKKNYITNTPIDYESVKKSFYDKDNLFYNNAALWIGLDTEYTVKDTFFDNCYAYVHTLSILPWVISGVCVSIIAFFAIFVVNTGSVINYYSKEGKEKLSDFDRLPIEVQMLFFILLGVVAYLMFRIFYSGTDFKRVSDFWNFAIPISVFFFVFALIVLALFYCLVRRISAANITEKSFFRWVFVKVFLRNSSVKNFMWRVYDDSGVAFRTWAMYLFFMVYNTFFACMLFFSKYQILCFFALLIFDILTGFYLFGKNIERKKIIDGLNRINEGDYDFQIDTTKIHGDNKSFAEAVNYVGRGIKNAVETSTKDEKLKADLITNVSHDIKTPLTSIINYVDLIKRENIDNERVQNYVKILDEKSQRLKQLTMDLVEASKAASGNIVLELDRINFIELLNQSAGEFEEKLLSKNLELVTNLPERPVYIMADPRRIWRIIENLFTNVYKYAMENTRVYMDLSVNEVERVMVFSLKNVSSNQLNFSADELTERFIRGDVARSTEGSGLGLSIAKSLTVAHGGVFDVYLDGDLFKVTLKFNLVDDKQKKP